MEDSGYGNWALTQIEEINSSQNWLKIVKSLMTF